MVIKSTVPVATVIPASETAVNAAHLISSPEFSREAVAL